MSRFTLPQGEYRWQSEAAGYPPGYSTLEYNFDFFNYAGIHRWSGALALVEVP